MDCNLINKISIYVLFFAPILFDIMHAVAGRAVGVAARRRAFQTAIAVFLIDAVAGAWNETQTDRLQRIDR